MHNFRVSLPITGVGAVRRAALTAGALLALAAVLVGGSSFTAAQFTPEVEPPALGINPIDETGGPNDPGGLLLEPEFSEWEVGVHTIDNDDPAGALEVEFTLEETEGGIFDEPELFDPPSLGAGPEAGQEDPFAPAGNAPPGLLPPAGPPAVSPPSPTSPAPAVPPGGPSDPAPAPPAENLGGYGGYGLIKGEHYPPGRLIIVYKESPAGPLGTVNELGGIAPGPEALLELIEADPVEVAVTEDLMGLDGGFDLSNVEVFGGVEERHTYFVTAEGEFDPLEVAFALNEIENVEFAHPDYYLEPAQSPNQNAQTASSNCFNNPDATNASRGPIDPCADTYAGWYIDNIRLDEALDFVAVNKDPRTTQDPIVGVLDFGFTRVNPRFDARRDSNNEPLSNPDLDGRWAYPGRENGYAPSGFVRFPIDTFNNDSDPFDNTSTHGSRVTSILAGEKGNRYGAYGVYQGGPGTIIPLNIGPLFGSGSAGSTLTSAIHAIDFASRDEDISAKVLNGSFIIGLDSGLGACRNFRYHYAYETVSGEALRRAIASFDGLYVAAAGNITPRYPNRDLGSSIILAPQSFAQGIPGDPTDDCEGIAKLDNLINVAATQQDSLGSVELWYEENGMPPRGSKYSPEYVQIAAPGHDVFVSNGDERTFFVDGRAPKIEGNVMSGTSYAAPQVSGTAALMLQVNSTLTPEQMIRIINFTGRRVDALKDAVYDGKTLDANAAVRCARALRDSAEPVFEAALRQVCVLPEFGFRSTINVEGNEGYHTVKVYVDLKRGSVPTEDITLNLEWGGTAVAGDDYDNHNRQSITFRRGWNSTWFSFYMRDDDLIEGEETVTIRLYAPRNAAVQEDAKLYHYTVRDNDLSDVPEFGFRTSEVLGSEGNHTVWVFVDRKHGSAEVSSPVNLDLAWSGSADAGSDYDNYGRWTIKFPPGSDILWLPFRVRDDKVWEGMETVEITLSPQNSRTAEVDPAASSYVYKLRDSGEYASQATVPEFGFTATAGAGEENNHIVNVSVETKNGLVSDRDITLNLAWGGSATAGEDDHNNWTLWNNSQRRWSGWQPRTSTITIPAGERFVMFEFSTLEDYIREPSETLVLTLSSPSSAATVQSESRRFIYTLEDNDEDPYVGFRTVSGSDSEGNRAVTLYLDSKNGVTATHEIFHHLRWGGTATAGSDYNDRFRFYVYYARPNAPRNHWSGLVPQTRVPGRLGGAPWLAIRIYLLEDGTPNEGLETVEITLEHVPGAMEQTEPDKYTHTIWDDD